MLAALESTKEAIARHKTFFVTTHINADGDGIGSELGLARFLRKLGKTATVLNSTPTPRNYRFLDPGNEIEIFNAASAPTDFGHVEAIFIVDISKWERLGPMTEFVRHHPALKICIDHHPVCGDFADVNLICQEACASGELVLDVINSLSVPLTPEIAEPLYASILTDTGAFRFPNTNAKTHLAAAQLISAGIDAAYIYEEIYERCSHGRVKILGETLCNLEYLHSGRLAWMMITQPMLRQTGVQTEEIEGFADMARGIRNVEASLLFIELADGKVKVSLRSKGNVDVNKFASRFGGGGHQHASGILMQGPIESAVNQVLGATSSLFAEAQKLVS